MTDLEITKLCAQAMGYDNVRVAHACMGTPYVTWGREGNLTNEFRPLEDDAQAMALVKKFYLDINYIMPFSHGDPWAWCVRGTIAGWEKTEGRDLNRAICECVAKMKEQK